MAETKIVDLPAKPQPQEQMRLTKEQLIHLQTLEQQGIWDTYIDPKIRLKVLWNKGFRGADLQRRRK